MTLFLLVATLGISVVLSSYSPSTLQLVHMIYRHGDRAPIDTFPSNPVPVSVWPQGLGSLTKLGIQQQYRLGQYVRRYYDGFINTTYINSEIRIRSTDRDRTLMSAESHLAGLYPPVNSQVWNPHISWQPIPVFTEPSVEDYLLQMDGPVCPRYTELFHQELNSPQIVNLIQENQPLFRNLTKFTGMNVNFTNAWMVADALFCQSVHNFTPPHWYTEPIKKSLSYIEAYEFFLRVASDAVVKLKGGPLLHEVTENMINKSQNLPTVASKIFMYSAHDDTIMAFFKTMHVFPYRVMPPYVATAFVELHRNEQGEYFVMVFYKNSTSDPHLLTVRGCTQKCPLDKFIKLTKPYACRNWKKDCGLIDGGSQNTFKTVVVIAALTPVIIVILFFIICAVRRVAKRRGDAHYTLVRNRFLEDSDFSSN